MISQHQLSQTRQDLYDLIHPVATSRSSGIELPDRCAFVGTGGNAYLYEAVLDRRLVGRQYMEDEDFSLGPIVVIERTNPLSVNRHHHSRDQRSSYLA